MVLQLQLLPASTACGAVVSAAGLNPFLQLNIKDGSFSLAAVLRSVMKSRWAAVAGVAQLRVRPVTTNAIAAAAASTVLCCPSEGWSMPAVTELGMTVDALHKQMGFPTPFQLTYTLPISLSGTPVPVSVPVAIPVSQLPPSSFRPYGLLTSTTAIPSPLTTDTSAAVILQIHSPSRLATMTSSSSTSTNWHAGADSSIVVEGLKQSSPPTNTSPPAAAATTISAGNRKRKRKLDAQPKSAPSSSKSKSKFPHPSSSPKRARKSPATTTKVNSQGIDDDDDVDWNKWAEELDKDLDCAETHSLHTLATHIAAQRYTEKEK